MHIIISLREELGLSKRIFEKNYDYVKNMAVFDYLVEYAFKCLCFYPDTDAWSFLTGFSHIPQLNYAPLTQLGVLDEDMLELEELFLQIYGDMAEKLVYIFPTRKQRYEAGLLNIERIDSQDTYVLK